MRDRAGIPPLTSLEIATGIVHGSVPASTEGTARSRRSPLDALDSACLAALRRPPCLVSFSGGFDSSLVLAVASLAAFREGLPPPVPATNRFQDVDHAQETHWQELVIRHLGLDDWVRLEFADELDVVGPVATRSLRRHGLLWPFNAHFHLPLLEAAAGGSVLTGIGGDEVFGRPRWARAAAVLRGRERPRARDLARVALLAAPRPLKRAVLARRLGAPFVWLTADANEEFARLWAADEAAEPTRVGPRLRELRLRRWLGLGLRSLELLAGDAGASIHHPLLSREFGSALGSHTRLGGHNDRVTTLRAQFGEVLPTQLLQRSSKARFDGAFWRTHSRELAASWDGGGADPLVVDRQALCKHWKQPEPDPHSFLLLQAAWLQRWAAGGVEKGIDPASNGGTNGLGNLPSIGQ